MQRRNAILFLGLLGGCVSEDTLSDDVSAPVVLSGNEQAFPGEPGVLTVGPIETPDGVVDVEYALHDGVAVFEGDILVRPAEHTAHGLGAPSTGRSSTSWRWANGIVPYEIGAGFSAAQRTQIEQAIGHFDASTIYSFPQRTTEADWIRFVPGTGCSSWVGRQGGRQDINLAPGCDRGSAIHEIGHAVGLWHEQSRADRDTHVIVNWNNITPGMEFNFQTYAAQGEDGQDMFDYDFGSIMHYSAFAFSRNGQPTLARADGNPLVTQRDWLSPTDIAGATRVLTKNGPATFKIVNLNSGHCLDVANASRASQAVVNQYTCHGNANQRWYFWTLPWNNKAVIINDHSGHCLDIPGGNLADGVQVQQFPCHGGGNQAHAIQWQLGGGFRMQVDHSRKCYAPRAPTSSSGRPVDQYACTTGQSQKWNMVW